MSDQWDFYFCQVDDKPASIFVDLGLHGDAPKPGFGHRACLSLVMRQPREDGLSSQEEYEALKLIEDAIGERLASQDTLYVGRNTSDGRRDFWFYLADAGGWEERVAAFMRAFPDYRFETEATEDPQWKAYFDFLYPNAEGLDFMSNGKVCDQLESAGDPLEEARDIDHWAYFPDAAARDAFVAQVAGLGFAVRATFDPDEDDERYCAQVFRRDVPSHRDIHGVTVPLLRAARALGGTYDGWETQVLRAEATH